VLLFSQLRMTNPYKVAPESSMSILVHWANYAENKLVETVQLESKVDTKLTSDSI
jgi:hypothetical protein